MLNIKVNAKVNENNFICSLFAFGINNKKSSQWQFFNLSGSKSQSATKQWCATTTNNVKKYPFRVFGATRTTSGTHYFTFSLPNCLFIISKALKWLFLFLDELAHKLDRIIGFIQLSNKLKAIAKQHASVSVPHISISVMPKSLRCLISL